ncbi:uncharacterized protein METZ01_LOCUS225103, partial [marine metagenome]
VSGFELLTLILLHHGDVPETVTCRWLTALTDRDWSLRNHSTQTEQRIQDLET